MKIKYTTDLHASLGGCQVQQINWRSNLERIGVKFTSSEMLVDFDLVHAFPILHPEKYSELLDYDKPLVISTNFWTRTNFARRILFYIANRVHSFPLTTRSLLIHNSRFQLFKGADKVIANSDAEKALLAEFFDLDPAKIEIVYNSISESFVNAAEPTISKQDHIVQIGSVSPRKGQIFAAELARRIDTKLVLIGTIMDRDYFSKIIDEYGNRILYVGNLENGSPEMLDYIDSALASVLISSWETPGLVNLEAASRGIPIITTETGGAREYLSDFAFYAEQGSRIDFSEIVKFIINDEKSLERRNHALKFSYNNAANQLHKIYQGLIA